MTETKSSPVPLAGTVADHPLDDIVRALCQQHRDAVVRVQHGEEWGTIEIVDGRVAAVEFRGTDGDEALILITALGSGSFSVDLRDRPSAAAIFGGGLDRALEEAQQRRARIEALIQAVGGPTQVFRIDVAVLSGLLEQIPDEVNAVMRLCDGRRTISEVLAATSFEEVTTLRVLQRLHALRVLKPADDGEPPEPTAPSRVADGAPLPTGVFSIGGPAALVDETPELAAGPPPAGPPPAGPPPAEPPPTEPSETAPHATEVASPEVAAAPTGAGESPAVKSGTVAPWVQHHLDPRSAPAPLVALWKDVDPASPVVARWTTQPQVKRDVDEAMPEYVPASLSEALSGEPEGGDEGDKSLDGWLDASEVNFFSLLRPEPPPFELPLRTQPRELFPYVLTLAFVVLVVAAIGTYVLVSAGSGNAQATADYYRDTFGEARAEKLRPVITAQSDQAKVQTPFEAALERARESEVEIGTPVVTPLRLNKPAAAAVDRHRTAAAAGVDPALKPIAEPVPDDAGKSFAQLYTEGMLLLKREKYALALPKFEAAMLRDPGDARVYLSIGQIYFEYGEVARALSYYRKAEALSPRTPKVHLLMGLALHEAGHYQEARQHYETYLSLSPEDSEASAVRGILETLPQ
ncbi:MAG: tetratricopeptide repeat protein [Deltaproteobacteria bacterium]|nr:tetratricopeptide repeat protein [Deltaproteobacteria bacterium]